MSFYLIQGSYTHEAWAALLKNPVDRSEGVKALLEGMGGHFHGLYYAFGKDDVLALFEAPDDKTAAAVSLAIAAPGHLQGVHTTVLLTPAELVESLRAAGGQTYRAPQG